MKEPVGYTNKVPGNQGTPVVEVLEFTEGQLAIQRCVAMLEEKVVEGIKAQRDLKSLRAEVCKHEVFDDTRGFPYDVRNCKICGANMGLV